MGVSKEQLADEFTKIIQNGQYKAADELLTTLRNSVDVKEYLTVELCIAAASLYHKLGRRDVEFQYIKAGFMLDQRSPELFMVLSVYYSQKNVKQGLICLYQARFYAEKQNDKSLVEQINEKISEYQGNGDLVPKSSFVILSFNTREYIRKCLESIKETIPLDRCQIIVVDNASSDKSVEYLRTLDWITLVENHENRGFPGGCNDGIAASDNGNDVYLLNSDTLLPYNAFFWLKIGLYENEKVGSTGSMTNYAANGQMIQKDWKSIDDIISFGNMADIPLENPYEQKLYLVGFSQLIKRTVLNEVGLLDERFFPGNSEDVDLGFRIIKAQKHNILCHNSFVMHFGNRSFAELQKTGIDYSTLLQKNNDKLAEKYGFDPWKCSTAQEIIDKLSRSESDCEHKEQPKKRFINEIIIGADHDDADIFINEDNTRKHLISIGRKSYVSQANVDCGSTRCNILIGRYTSIAHRVTFELGLEHNYDEVSTYPFRDFDALCDFLDDDINHYYECNSYQIIIGNDVRISEGVRISGGVHIGNGAVIGMGAVVTSDVPPYSVVAGNPAKVVKYRFDEDTIAKLEEIKWWNWDESAIESARREMSESGYFAEKYYQGLKIPRTDFTDVMDSMIKAGGQIFYYVLDYDGPKPFWDKVIYSFEKAFSHNDNQMLIIEVPVEYENKTDFSGVNALVDRFCAECQGIIKVVKKDTASSAVFFHATTYIAGADIRSLPYVDMAEYLGMDVKSACDWESGLFEKPEMHAYVKDDKPLVSICIPTYNRAEYLKTTLDSIVCQPEFKAGMVEVVISDNCSTDNTEAVGKQYAATHTGVRYYRNEKNVVGRNFPIVLCKGRGKLRKLNNDTCTIRPGGLSYMCKMVKKYECIRPVMYFGNMVSSDEDNDVLLNLRNFLVKESFHITWIGAFAMWDEDCDGSIIAEPRDNEQLWQTRKLVDMIQKRKAAVSCDKAFMAQMLSFKDYKADWMWEVFHDEYFYDIGEYITTEDKEYIEKDLLFNHFGEMEMQAEMYPKNIVLDNGYMDKIAEHYKDKPYWNDFCVYYNDWKNRIFNKTNFN